MDAAGEPLPAVEVHVEQQAHEFLFGSNIFADGKTWKGAPSGWLREDLSPKPVYAALHELIKREWWTRVAARTDSQGRCRTRAFFGDHRVSCVLPDGRRTTAEVTLARAAGRATCRLEPRLP